MSNSTDVTMEDTRTRELEPFSPTLARKRSFEPLPVMPATGAYARLWFAALAVGLTVTVAVGYVLGTHLLG